MRPVIDQLLNLVSDKPSLIVLIVRYVALDLAALTEIGPQLLLPAILIARNQRIGRRQNRLRRAIVLLQQNRRGLRIVLLKLLNIANSRTTEGINGLVRIAHHTQLTRRHISTGLADERRDQNILRMVGVLVLVHQHMPEAATVILCNLRVTGEDPNDLTD